VTLEAASEASQRVTKRVEELFRVMPASVNTFDHFAPAMYLTAHPELWESVESDADEHSFGSRHSLLLSIH
jgi:hypothetical protein